jgi:eukaryotic-like serine/threonine-protein kinase
MAEPPASADGDDDVPTDRDDLLAPGTLVGEYEIDGPLGSGTFGMVYAAEHPVIGKRAAIKVLHQRFMSVPEVVSRFVSEARAVNKIRHRNIIDVFSIGKLDSGQRYLIMELLEGDTLDAIVARRGRLRFAEAYPILKGIADALDAAHAVGVIHRDLKPDNVFVARSNDGFILPKLLDFGIAKLIGDDSTIAHRTRTGLAVGTPLYMSPEQCRAKKVDRRTDVYALGVMTYQLLSGTVPYDGESAVDVMFKHMSEAMPDISSRVAELPAELDAPLAHMLAKRPDERPDSAGDAIKALVKAAIAGGIEVDNDAVRASQLDVPVPGSAPLTTGPTYDADAPTKISDPAAPVASTSHTGAVPSDAVPSDAVPSDAAATQRSAPDPLGPTEPPPPPEIAVERAPDTVGGLEARSAVAASTAALSSSKTSAERRPRSKSWAIVAALAAIAAGGGFLYATSQPKATAAAPAIGTTPPADDATASAPAPTDDASEASASTALAAPKEVTITIALEPKGATIRRGAELLSLVDGHLTLPHGEEAVALDVSQPGYISQTIEVTPGTDQALEVRLAPIPRASPAASPKPLPRPNPQPEPSPKTGPADVLSDRN